MNSSQLSSTDLISTILEVGQLSSTQLIYTIYTMKQQMVLVKKVLGFPENDISSGFKLWILYLTQPQLNSAQVNSTQLNHSWGRLAQE